MLSNVCTYTAHGETWVAIPGTSHSRAWHAALAHEVTPFEPLLTSMVKHLTDDCITDIELTAVNGSGHSVTLHSTGHGEL